MYSYLKIYAQFRKYLYENETENQELRIKTGYILQLIYRFMW